MTTLVEDIAERVQASQALPHGCWKFTATSARTGGGHCGVLDYVNRFVGVKRAVSIDGWVLCLEQAVLGEYVSWALGAFKGNSHYTFRALGGATDDEARHYEAFEKWVTSSLSRCKLRVINDLV